VGQHQFHLFFRAPEGHQAQQQTKGRRWRSATATAAAVLAVVVAATAPQIPRFQVFDVVVDFVHQGVPVRDGRFTNFYKIG